MSSGFLASEEQLNENNERLVLITVTWQTMFLAAALMFNSNSFLALKSTIGNFVAVEFLCWGSLGDGTWEIPFIGVSQSDGREDSEDR